MGSGGSASPQLIGYGYYVGFAYAFCGESDKFLSIYRNGDIVWEGSATTGELMYGNYGDKGDPNASFGSAEGYGIAYNGEQLVADPYLASHTTDELSYYGTSYISYPQPFIGDNVQALPNLEAVVQRLTLGTPITPEAINDDINPISLIYYMLVDLMSVPENRLDLDSFQYASQICVEEGRGVSIVISRAKSIIDWINLVLNHAEGALVVDSFTGAYKINLVRGDYDKSTLPVIHEEDCSKLEFKRNTWLNTYSSFIFKYTDAANGFKEDSVEYRNTAAIQLLGQDRAKSESFTLFTNTTSLQNAVNSYMRNNSYPLAAVKLTTNLLDFPNLNVGDVFKLDAPSLGISEMIMRVGEIGGDEEGEINVDLEATEDIFGLSVNIPAIVGGSIGSGIDYSIGDFEYADIKPSYPETSGDVPAMTPVYVLPEGALVTVAIELPDGLTQVVAPWVLGELETAIDPYWTKGEITLGEPIRVRNVSGLFTINANPEAFARMQYGAWIGMEQVVFGKLTLIDAEEDIWEMDDIVHNTNGTPKDTPYDAHIPANTKIWISTVPVTDIVSVSIEPNETVTSTYTFLSYNRKGSGTPYPVSFKYTGAAAIPYPPSDLELSTTDVLWTPSYRLSGATYFSVDDIVSGQDEPLAYQQEGYFEVWEVNSAGTLLTKLGDVNTGVALLPFRFSHGLSSGKYVGIRKVNNAGRYSSVKMIRV